MRQSKRKRRSGTIAALGAAATAILVVAAVTVSHAQLATSIWPMFHHDLKHTGLSTVDTSANPGTQKWKFATGSGIYYSSPAIGADGTIYVGSRDGNLYAVNPDGTQKWKLANGSYVAPAIGADGTIYAGSSNLYAVNPDGTQKWKFAIGTTYSAVSSSPAIGADSIIYVGFNDGNLYAINPDGTQKWKFATGGNSSPAIDADGTIYVGSGDPNYSLYAVNRDGTQKWKFATGRYLSSPAIGADGTIYVGSNAPAGTVNSYLYAVNPDGTQKWAFVTAAIVSSTPAIAADGTIYVGSFGDDITGISYLYAVNPGGTQKWRFATGGVVYSSPAIGSDGTIYVGTGAFGGFVGSGDDNLYAVNPDGTQKWAFLTGGFVGSSPAIGSDGTIYVGSNDGNLYAVGGAPSQRTPVVIIPGVLGSELNRADNGHLVWLDTAAFFPQSAELFQLLLQQDGQTPDTHPVCTKSLKPCSGDFDCTVPGEMCAFGGTNVIPEHLLSFLTYHPYQDLVDFLTTKGGYTFGIDLFVFPYDWRRDDSSAATIFDAWVNSHLPPNTTFDIIAHSQGGLVTRAYLKQQGGDRVNSVIYLGTPQSGAPRAYSSLKGETTIVKTFNGAIPGNVGPSLNLKTLSYISQHFTAAYELLPRFNFVRRSSLGAYEPFANTYSDLSTQTLVDTANSFWAQAIGNNNPVSRSFQINGTKHRTLLALDLSDPECPKGLSDPTGDGTVPTVSSKSFLDRSVIYYVDEEHSKLPGNSQVQEKVLNILQGRDSTSVPGVSSDFMANAEGWRWYSCSPIRVQIQDQDANTDVLDRQGNLLEEIEDSTQLEFPTNEGGFLPFEKTYSIAVRAIDNGLFTLNFDHLVSPDDAISSSITFAGIPVSSRSRATLTLSPADSAPVLSLDVDGDGSPDFFIPANVPAPAPSFVAVLTDVLDGFGLPRGIENSLQKKLDAARAALARGNLAAAHGQLSAFLNEVSAQRGKGLTGAEADILVKIGQAGLTRT
jgi:outer membrane protein assembly factor BamB/pimeloyl-ACP methyl ester carboxylesterase